MKDWRCGEDIAKRLMNVGNDWDGEVDYVPVEGPWENVAEKEV